MQSGCISRIHSLWFSSQLQTNLVFGVFLQVLEHQGVVVGTGMSGAASAQRKLACPLIGREVISLGSAVASRAGITEPLFAFCSQSVDVGSELFGIHPSLGACSDPFVALNDLFAGCGIELDGFFFIKTGVFGEQRRFDRDTRTEPSLRL